MKRGLGLLPSVTSLLGAGILALPACDSDDLSDDLSTTLRYTEIVASPGSLGWASLGMGYNVISELFAGSGCATGEPIEIGGLDATLIWERSMSREEVAASLGFELEARARYGVSKFSGAAAFAATIQENSYSSTAVYSAHYRLNQLMLQNPEIREPFKNLPDDKFVESCGHEYVEQIAQGAKIFISVKVDLYDEAAKQEFETSFRWKGPAAKVSASLQQAQEHFAGRGTITVQAYQLGGDVSRLSAVLSGTSQVNEESDSLHAVISCGFDDIESCSIMLETALHYATSIDDPQAFPQQIKDSPVHIGYVTKDWATAGRHMDPPLIGQAIRAARNQLSSMFEEDLMVLERIRDLRKMSGRIAKDQLHRLPELEQRALHNIGLITDAVPECYDTIDNCVDSVAQVSAQRQITPFEELSFKMGPISAGLYLHRGTLLRTFSDETFCFYESIPHYAYSGPDRAWYDYILLPDWDTFRDAMHYTGLCRLDLELGVYASHGSAYKGEGDQLCSYVSPTHFVLGAAPFGWGDVVVLDFEGFYEMVTVTGHCPVFLPAGVHEYQGKYYRSDGEQSYCLSEPVPNANKITEDLPFEEFMILTGECA